MEEELKIDLGQLRQLLITSFNEDELQDLAFDLEIDYEALPGNGKKARELIAYCKRDGCIPELIAACRNLRPKVSWPSLPEKPETIPPSPSTVSSTRALHQLRPPVADFMGRTDEIDKVVQSLRQAAQRGATVLIWGMGGLGKTELAHAVAEQLLAEFPDAQLLLKLQGASDTPLSPERALQQVIQEFAPQSQASDDLDRLQAFYQSLLRNKRVLILADDAGDIEQVQRLAPPPGCALLITSRNLFRPPGATVVEPKTLPEAAAVELLETICKRLGNTASRLAQLCGYLPLALRVSAGLLANDPMQKVDDYLKTLEIERLRYLKDPDNPDDPAASVEASLNLSYNALNDAGQRTLEQISVFSTGFDLSAARQVVSLQGIKRGAGDERALQSTVDAVAHNDQINEQRLRPKGRAAPPGVKDVLRMLYLRSLLEYDLTTERYNLHGLVRAFATERLHVTTAQLRYVHYYLEVAKQSNSLYFQGHEHTLEGLTLFDRERGHIDAAWKWLQHQVITSEIDELVLSYATETSNIGDLRYDVRREQIPQLEKALASARRLKKKRLLSAVLGNLGSAYAALGETRRAIELQEQALTISRGSGNRPGESSALLSLGRAYADLGETQRTIELYEHALAISRDLEDRRRESNALGSLGSAYADLGETRHAIELYEQALIISRELGDRRGESSDFNSLGLAYATLGETQRAIELHQQALNLDRDLGDRQGEAASLGNLGRVYVDLGDALQSVQLCEQSLSILREVGNRRHEGYALHFLGLAYVIANKIQQAQILQEQALDIARTVEDRLIQCQVLDALGEIWLAQDDELRAQDFFEQALMIAQEIEARHLAAKSSWNLGLTHERQGNLARAIELMQVRVDYEREIGHLKAGERAERLAEVRSRLEAGEG